MARSLMFEDEDQLPLATRRSYGDEPMGGYGAPPPAPPPVPAPMAPRGPQPLDIDPYFEQLNRINAAQAARPPDPKPKLWQRILAGGIGGLGGAVNAGGRVSVDTAPVTEEILAPGHKRKMAEWQQGVADARMGADTEAAKLTWLQKMQDAESQRDLQGAQTERLRKQPPPVAPLSPAEKTRQEIAAREAEGQRQGLSGEALRNYSLYGNREPQPKPEPAPARPITSVNDAGDMTLIDPTDPTKQTVVPKVGKKTRPQGSTYAGASSPDDAKEIADAIARGEQSPRVTGLYRMGAPVKAELARQGYNLARAEQDWTAIQRHLSTLNGPQQERLRQAVTFTYDSLDVIEDLFNEWKKVGRIGGVNILNRANLEVAKQLPGNAGAVAQSLEAQINDLVSELGTVYKGGNASTDESLRLAAENLKADWNEEQFRKQLGLIRKNLQIRKNSILSSEAIGVSPNSPYAPPRAAETPPQDAGGPQSATSEPTATNPQTGEKMVLRGGQWVPLK